MKTWFFRKKWQDRKGRWRTAIYAMIAMDGHITEGGSVGEAIYMAHDLIACLKSCSPDDSYKPTWLENYSENKWGLFLDVPCIGMMDIDVDLIKRGWLRKGDLPPSTRPHTRYRMYRKAFKMVYSSTSLILEEKDKTAECVGK